MLESRPEDALDSLVQTVETAKTVKTVETVETVETVNTVEPVETVQTVFNEDLKKYELLTHLLCDNLKARDASASKNVQILVLAEGHTLQLYANNIQDNLYDLVFCISLTASDHQN